MANWLIASASPEYTYTRKIIIVICINILYATVYSLNIFINLFFELFSFKIVQIFPTTGSDVMDDPAVDADVSADNDSMEYIQEVVDNASQSSSDIEELQMPDSLDAAGVMEDPGKSQDNVALTLPRFVLHCRLGYPNYIVVTSILSLHFQLKNKFHG